MLYHQGAQGGVLIVPFVDAAVGGDVPPLAEFVLEPFLVSVGATRAVLPAELGEDEDGHAVAMRWQTVALLHMVRFSELNGQARRRRKGKKAS